MLTITLYHTIGTGKHQNQLAILEQHFAWIATHCLSCLPGELLSKSDPAVCLTFDDAFADFYHLIFPLLQKYQLKAVLGVPVGYIAKNSMLPISKRVDIDKLFPSIVKPSPLFCTWEELNELNQSPLVQIASHSWSHCSLKENNIDDYQEIVASKERLNQMLRDQIDTFIYPFGHFNERVHKITQSHYKYIFRIGSANNRSWYPSNRLLYRIPADQLPFASYPFTLKFKAIHTTSFLFNKIRKR